MAAPLMMAGAGMMLFGGMMQMGASRSAAQDTRMATAAQLRSRYLQEQDTAEDMAEEGAAVAGTIVARTGAAGFEITGSPYVAAMTAISDSQKDIKKLREYGAMESQYISQTGRSQARSYEAQGQAALFGGLGSAAMAGANYGQATGSRGGPKVQGDSNGKIT